MSLLYVQLSTFSQIESIKVTEKFTNFLVLHCMYIHDNTPVAVDKIVV